MGLNDLITKNIIINNNPEILFDEFKEDTLQIYYNFDVILNENTNIKEVKNNPLYKDLFNICENTIEYRKKYQLTPYEVIHNLYYLAILWKK